MTDKYDDGKKRHTVTLAEERVELGTKKVVDRRVRITRATRVDEKNITAELTQENADIKRFAKNEVLEAQNIPQIRQEGDVTIIPIIEERVEIIKHYVLTEEIHIIKKRSTERHQEIITLRSQEIIISTEDE
ncbi:YsnF/AvaK domain-containing protein [Leclercia sp. H6W5]|uniref:YsnF/AvaK domain-containing protein n=1 Tax=Leclercia TaxID=83654 RepID=UPI0021D35054|nr:MULTISPECIES: YsnF/AvaK domain-containing protein [Leclercia]MCU6680726.1 YsnF/AvaK domain-containing protein [Leclercia tamurae]